MFRINIKPYTVIRILLICAVVLAVVLAYNLIAFFKYQKINAKIISLDTEVYEGVGDSQTSKAHFVTYQFIYQNRLYEVKRQTFTKIGKHIGDNVVLRFDPHNPHHVLDSLLIYSCIIGIVVLGFIMFILIRQNPNVPGTTRLLSKFADVNKKRTPMD